MHTIYSLNFILHSPEKLFILLLLQKIFKANYVQKTLILYQYFYSNIQIYNIVTQFRITFA
ncbi:hypothetical protein Hanom_Chr08g00726841 [Helianthus anomalus]